MKTKKRLYILASISLLLLYCLAIACSDATYTTLTYDAKTLQAFTPLYTSTTVSIAQNRNEDWLKGVPCVAPCFLNIIPGNTNAQQVYNMLSQNPLVGNVYISNAAKDKDGAVVWKWKDGTKGGEAYWSRQSTIQTINQIAPYLREYKLEEIVKYFGEPSHIAAKLSLQMHGNESSHYEPLLLLVYLNKGLVLAAILKNDNLILTPETRVQGPVFLIPGQNSFEESYPGYRGQLLEWQGYKDFNFYCRDDGGKDTVLCDRFSSKKLP